MPPTGTNNFFGIKVSKSGLPVQNASDKQLVYKDDFSTKTYFDQTNSRMLEGLLPDGSYGLWVSSPGVDVTTADPSLPGQLSFNSSNDTFQVLISGTTNIPGAVLAAGGLAWNYVSVPHNLGFAPIVQAYISTTVAVSIGTSIASFVALPINSDNFLDDVTGDTGSPFYIFATADTQNVYFSYFYFAANPGAGATIPSFPVQYYLVNVSTA